MIHPLRVYGPWDDGCVLDKYNEENISKDSFSSIKANSAFDYIRFREEYTLIGNLLYSMKYNGHFDTSKEITKISEAFIRKWTANKKIDIILPAPPTIVRHKQPVFLIASKISSLLDVPCITTVLRKTSTKPSKNISKANRCLSGSIIQEKSARRRCNILLVDDFYSSGKTASECVRVLKKDPLIQKVYYLAIVKTR